MQVGEAAHPGPLRLVTANVTSFLTQGDVISDFDADILCLQETRLSEFGQRDMSRKYEEQGWHRVWGRPQPPQSRTDTSFQPGPWNATHGGVGILVRGLVARNGNNDSDTRKWLWDTGRWMHAMVKDVMLVYGYIGASRNREAMLKNEELLNAVLRVAAELGNVPILVAGDINIDTQASSALCAALATHLA